MKRLKLKAPARAGAGTGAGLALRPADAPGYVNTEPGLGTPPVDVADLLTAPVGVATTLGKMAAVAAEPFVSYGLDRAGNWLGNRLGGLLGYFGWGE